MKEIKVVALKTTAFSLPTELAIKWADNAKRFIAPLALMYIAQLLAEFSLVANGTQDISGSMFLPTQIMLGGMGLYVLNVLMDLFLKWKNPQTFIKK